MGRRGTAFADRFTLSTHGDVALYSISRRKTGTRHHFDERALAAPRSVSLGAAAMADEHPEVLAFEKRFCSLTYGGACGSWDEEGYVRRMPSWREAADLAKTSASTHLWRSRGRDLVCVVRPLHSAPCTFCVEISMLRVS